MRVLACTFSAALLVTACGAPETYPDDQLYIGGGKAIGGVECPLIDMCKAETGAEPAVIKMDAAACPTRTHPAEVTKEYVWSLPVCPVAPGCFPSVEYGKIIASRDGLGSCVRMHSTYYRFQGAAKPYMLKVQVERAVVESGSDWAWKQLLGRGHVRLEVRRFRNGVSTDVKRENPEFVDGDEIAIYPGEAVTVIPVPSGDSFFEGLDQFSHYLISFERFEIPGDASPPMPESMKPDYQITDFKVRTTPGSKRVVYTVEVCNMGGVSDKPVDLEIFRSADKAPSCEARNADLERQVKGPFWPGAGECRIESFEEEEMAPGYHTAYAMIDGDCEVDEGTGEANNVSKPASYTVDDTPQEGIEIKEFEVHVIDSKVHFWSRVCNFGSLASQPTKLRIWAHLRHRPRAGDIETQTTSFDVPALQPNECTTHFEHKQDNMAKGSYDARALVGNSVAQFEYTVVGSSVTPDPGTTPDPEPDTTPDPGKPDLTVADVAAAVNGQAVTFMVKVCNNGKAMTGAATIGLYYDVAAPKCDISPDHTWQLPALDEGDCKLLTTAVNRDEGGFTASALADSACAIEESDELNNGKSKSYSVGAGATPQTPAERPNPKTGTDPAGTPSPYGQQPYTPPVAEQAAGCSLAAGNAAEGAASALPLLLLLLGAAARRRR